MPAVKPRIEKPVDERGEEMIDELCKSLGIPKRIFQGNDRLSGVEPIIRKVVEEATNPLEFAFLFPLGKRAYKRRYSKTPKFDIRWEK